MQLFKVTERLIIKNTNLSRVSSILRRKIRVMTGKERQELELVTAFKRLASNNSPNTDKEEERVSYRDFIPSPNERRRRPGYDPQERMIALLGELSKIESGDSGQRTDSLKYLSYPELKREFMRMEKEFIHQRYCN